MEFDELLITTGVDALVRLVKEKRKIELSIASQLLDIPSQTLEEWGHILEEEGILKIEYSLTKIFFLWVEPTAEQIAAEKTGFYEERKGLEEEVKTLKASVEPEIKNLERLQVDFSQLYDRLYPKLVELEKNIEALPTKERIPTQIYGERIKTVQSRIDTLEDTLLSIKTEMENVNKQLMATPMVVVTKSAERFETLKKDLDGLKAELDELGERGREVSHTVPSEMPPLADIKKKFETLKTEFGSVKGVTITLRDDFQNLKETCELLGSVESSIKRYDDDIGAAKQDVEYISKTLVEIKNRSNALTEKVKEQAEIVSRFADSISVAKNILTRFPSKEEFVAKLDNLSAAGKDVEERINAMETLLSSFSAPSTLLARFDRLKSDINTKLSEMEKEAEAISKVVDEESSTYATFQKIKERAVVSLAAYNSQLKDLNAEIQKLKNERAALEQQLAKDVKTYTERLGQKDVQDIAKIADGLKEKKELLDRISVSMDSLSNDADNLNKRLALLAKEAAMIDIRTSGISGEVAKEKRETEVRQQLTLTKDEEEEFRRKREELRDLIKKLWEEE